MPDSIIIPAELAGQRLDQALARLFPAHSRARLQGWIKEGRVRLGGALPDGKLKVWGGERLEVDPPGQEVVLDAQPQDIALDVLYQDEALLVINKPAGLVVHPGSGVADGTLMNALLHLAPELAGVPRAGIVHRLDKDTSGLLVVARTLEAQTDLVRQLQARSVNRRYLAVVHGEVTGPGTVDAPIGRHPSQRTRMAVVEGGREAVTHYVIRERLVGATLLECRLETGRTHQIRVHLAHVGYPLVGDPVYGRRRVLASARGFTRQALHAWQLGLEHPLSGEEMQWSAPPPADFEALLRKLREGA